MFDIFGVFCIFSITTSMNEYFACLDKE